jgi:hypothetical protein
MIFPPLINVVLVVIHCTRRYPLTHTCTHTHTHSLSAFLESFSRYRELFDEKTLRHLVTCRTWDELQQICDTVKEFRDKMNPEDRPKSPPADKFSTDALIGMVLMRCRRNFRFETLEAITGIHERTLRRYIHEERWLKVVADAIYRRFVVLSREALSKHTFPAFQNQKDLSDVVGLLDCTYIYIGKSSSMNFQVCMLRSFLREFFLFTDSHHCCVVTETVILGKEGAQFVQIPPDVVS